MVCGAAARSMTNGCRGFATGEYTEPSLYTTSIAGTSTADQLSDLLHRTDLDQGWVDGRSAGLQV